MKNKTKIVQITVDAELLLYIAYENANGAATLEKSSAVFFFFFELSNSYLPCDLAVPSIDVYPREIETYVCI